MAGRTVTGAALALGLLSGAALAQEVSIEVANDPGDLEDVIRLASFTAALDATDPEVVAQDYVAAARADYRRILTAMYSEGYYGPVISILVDGREASTIPPLDSPARVGTVRLRVDPGPQFTFGTAEVAPRTEETELPPEFATGEPARAGVIRDAAEAGIEGWRQAGHPLVEIGAEEITAIHPQERLDARVGLAPGPQLNFGTVTVTGNEAVRTDRILAIAGLPQGRLYDPDEVEDAIKRLRRTGAFDTVALVEAEVPGPNGTLPVEIQVAESLPRRIGAGAELSTTDGLSLSAFWMHRNLLGGAERLRVEAEVEGIGGQTGGIDYRLGLDFTRPATFRRDTDLNFSAQIAREEEETYLSDSVRADLTLTRYVNDRLTLDGGPGLHYALVERDGVEREYQLLTLPLQATYDARENQLNPTSGFFIDLDTTPFYSIDEGHYGARLYGDARAYFGLGSRVVLAGRLQAGSVLGIDDLLDVPADYLFYSGGGGTVRGQPYRSLSIPVSQNGNTIDSGGRSFVGAQLEARVRITETIGAVAFYDIGAISENDFPDADSPWHAGVGIGARYLSPVGAIRLDLGTPASGDDAFEELQVYIGIGQAF